MNLLIISTVSCFLEYAIPSLIKYVSSHVYTITKHDMELRNNLINLKQEIINVSMVDEFSKYAKLQRKYNKLENELKEKANERAFSKMKVQLSVTYGFRILNGLLMLILVYLYRNTPVITLPKGILWPLENLLSWPCYSEDSISFIVWLAITKLVMGTYKKSDIT